MPESKRQVEGRPSPPREFAGNRKRFREGDPIPALQFGQHGELTPRTIKQANLSPAEEKRAFEMVKVQAAYLEILEALSYPIDPEGAVHDLSALGPTRLAIAWTLALNGFRRTGVPYIKKRSFEGLPGVYQDAHTWVDARAPDSAEEELKPEHRANDPRLPPDTRRLAAIRDGAPPMQMPDLWKVKPEVVYVDEPRKERP
jgi:hypothetical protein